MGRMGAEGMAYAVDEGMVDLRRAVEWHLMSNHYPPVNAGMVDPCLEAIDAANQGDYRRLIHLHGAALYKGEPYAPAWAIIDAHHLDTFIDGEEE